MEPLTLTPDEVAEVTGRKQPKLQIRWLSENGWKFWVGADGCPKVARSFFEAQYGAPEKERKRVPRFKMVASGS